MSIKRNEEILLYILKICPNYFSLKNFVSNMQLNIILLYKTKVYKTNAPLGCLTKYIIRYLRLVRNSQLKVLQECQNKIRDNKSDNMSPILIELSLGNAYFSHDSFQTILIYF